VVLELVQLTLVQVDVRLSQRNVLETRTGRDHPVPALTNETEDRVVVEDLAHQGVWRCLTGSNRLQRLDLRHRLHVEHRCQGELREHVVGLAVLGNREATIPQRGDEGGVIGSEQPAQGVRSRIAVQHQDEDARIG
jgi:hypothetical protein